MARWKDLDRLRRVMKSDFYPPPSIDGKMVCHDPPSAIPFRVPKNFADEWSKRFVLLAPSLPLGGFVGATVNFDNDRARRNVALGVQVATAALELGQLTDLGGG
jgi:hypothetical protein